MIPIHVHYTHASHPAAYFLPFLALAFLLLPPSDGASAAAAPSCESQFQCAELAKCSDRRGWGQDALGDFLDQLGNGYEICITLRDV